MRGEERRGGRRRKKKPNELHLVAGYHESSSQITQNENEEWERNRRSGFFLTPKMSLATLIWEWNVE